MKKQIFINKFQTGSTENANMGMGNIVGFDIYSKKGVARLAKKTTITAGGIFTAEPHFIETSSLGDIIWIQLGDGNVIYSTDGGVNFVDSSFPSTGAGFGNGLIYFQGFIFAFTPTKIYYHTGSTGVGAWTDWTTAKTLGALPSFATNPIQSLHFPFLYPNNRGVYFGNGSGTNAGTTLGFFGQVGNNAFDPTGAIGVNFLYNNAILQFPSSTYVVGSIDFLPPSSLAISVVNINNPAQSSDLITWDTISANKFSPPLRLYSNSFSNSSAPITGGIKQIMNRNQVLYAVSGGNHTIYETNGSNWNLVEDINLFSNVRTTAGAENETPVYFNSYPQAITVVGNKLLTGVATITNTTTYPPTGTGIFPIGIWSVTFNPDNSKSIQCEFILPIDSVNISPSGTGNYSKITCIKPIGQVGTSSSQIMFGFSYNSTGGGFQPGIGVIDLYNYIDNRNYTAIESELFEIGTALIPQTVNNIEINLAKKLLLGQSIEISYRTSIDQNWSTIDTYFGDGTTNYYPITKNPIGATQFIQLRIQAATGGGGNNTSNSPEIRTVILS